MTKVNIEDIPNYLILADQLNIKNINFSTLFEWESNKLLWLSRDEGKKIMKIVKSGLKLSKKLGIKTNLSAIQEFGVFEHRPPKFCFAPWYMLFINASREAIMCCTLASLYQNRLGKVRSLAKIWNSEKMEGIRRRMKTRKFFNECKKCLPEFTQMFDNLYKEMRRWKLKK
jgi:MoaA/NifB/PqqE/SkfB family radical SAM enzyme